MKPLAPLAWIAILLLCHPAHGQDPTIGSTPSRDTVLEHLFIDLNSRNETIRREAFREILSLGPPVLPTIRRRLQETGEPLLLDLQRALEALERNSRTPGPAGEAPERRPDSQPPAATRLTAEEFNALRNEAPAVSADAVDRYIYRKYIEAADHAREGRFEESLQICRAILLLEPKTPCAPRLKRLCIHCEEQLLRSELLAVELQAEKDLVEIGDEIRLTLRLTNRSAAQLVLQFPAGGAYAQTRIETWELDPFGGRSSTEHDEDIELPERVTLKPGESWVGPVSVSTGSAAGARRYREYRISCEVRSPNLRRTDKPEASRRIPSETVTVRAFPPDVDPVLAAPLDFLANAVDSGRPDDIFLCSLLLPPSDRTKGMEILMRAFARATRQGKRALMTCFQHLTGLPLGYDEQAWIEWWKNR